jgi:hypothetical protein
MSMTVTVRIQLCPTSGSILTEKAWSSWRPICKDYHRLPSLDFEAQPGRSFSGLTSFIMQLFYRKDGTMQNYLTDTLLLRKTLGNCPG